MVLGLMTRAVYARVKLLGNQLAVQRVAIHHEALGDVRRTIVTERDYPIGSKYAI